MAADKLRKSQASRDDSTCQRCREHAASITVRAEHLCLTCFNKYVQTKVVKRLETTRNRGSDGNKQPTFLLPLSLGACSVTLLHVLSNHLQGQVQRSGRPSSKLHILHISDDGTSSSMFEQIKARYPEHSYSMRPLSDILQSDVKDIFPSLAAKDQDTADLSYLLSQITSSTAKTDVVNILRTRLIVEIAKKENCQAILWGHSTTRLAEQTLAETAKGRAAYLPWTVADGVSPSGIPFYFLMRELLTKEIITYASLVDPPLLHEVVETSTAVSTKNASIDSLMRQYFDSAELEYPSIVANVVKTAGKLKPTPLELIEQQCELCEMPLAGQSPEKSRLCYSCIRLVVT